MRRYFLNSNLKINTPKSYAIGETLPIEGDLYKHIFKVCRRSVGDGFELLTEDELALFVRAVSVEKNVAHVEIKEIRKLEPLPRPYLHLVLSNPRPQVFERVLEKSVELGVASITPLISAHSFFKKPSKVLEKEKRHRKIVLQAQQQTGRGQSLIMNSPCHVDEFLKKQKECENPWRGYIFYEALEESLDLESVCKQEGVEDLYILVGGEGGFQKDEVELFNKAGFKSVSLGRQILRVETACVASISILKSRWGLWV